MVQINKMTKEIIKIWESISDAAEQVLGDRKSSSITAACKGRKKTTGGFCWQYYDRSNNLSIPIPTPIPLS